MLHGAGIFTYNWMIFRTNVGKYSIHGAYGITNKHQFHRCSPGKKSNTAHTCEHREIVEGFRVSLHILSEEPRQRHLDRHGCHGPTGPAGRQASGVLFATVKQIERGFK